MLVVKTLFLGAPGTGTSSIIRKFCVEEYEGQYIPTVGVNFLSKDLSSEESKKHFESAVRHQIWDCSSHQDFKQAARSLYSTTAAFVFVISCDNAQSIEGLQECIAEVDHMKPKTAVKLLVCNKADLGKNTVPSDRITSLTASAGLEYMEVSARQNNNISKIFDTIGKLVGAKIASGELVPDESGTSGVKKVVGFAARSVKTLEDTKKETNLSTGKDGGCLENCNLI